MGCCASSGTTDRNKEIVSDNITEEETIVKEVLSETTFLTTSPTKSKIREEEEEEEEEKEDNFKKPKPGMTRPDSIDPELGSEISEICSLSLSESVSSTVMMNGYDEEETKQRRKSPARSRTRVTGHNNNYPTRRSDQSPRKRNTAKCNGARSDQSPGKRNNATCNGARSDQSPGKRNNATCNGARYGSGIRDPGERSGRRSRSPAMNRSVLDPNQSRAGGSRTCRKNAESPGRVMMDPNRTGLDHDGRGQQQHDNYGYTTEELLGNPLVSLECFIFL